MKRIPKTPIEFDYDLWTTEDGKCMVRVKRTGEVTEVDREVMKVLRAEEKKLRRSYTGGNSEDTDEAEDKNSILSLDALPDDDVKSSSWLADPRDFVKELETQMLIDDFRLTLSEIEQKVLDDCLLGGTTVREFSTANGLPKSSVWDIINSLRKNLKNIF